MNVLYLINHAGYAGSERYVLTLAQNLAGRARLFFVYNEYGPLADRISPYCEKTERITMKCPFDPAAVRRLIKFISNNDIDIVHAQYPRENYLAILASLFCKRVKIVYTAHWNRRDTFIRTLANRLMTRADAAALAVGAACAELMKKNGYPASRISVIYPGTKIPPEEKRERGGRTLPSDIVTPRGAFVFACLARLSEEKGLRFLLESAAALKRTSPGAPFCVLIAGDGEQRAELEALRLASGLQNEIILLGQRDDCPDILSGAGAYVSPSREESFGFGVVEALAHSLPVITTGANGSADITGGGTDVGIRVAYGDSAALAGAMAEMMKRDEKYALRAANARLLAKTRFSENAFASAVYEIYQSVI